MADYKKTPKLSTLNNPLHPKNWPKADLKRLPQQVKDLPENLTKNYLESRDRTDLQKKFEGSLRVKGTSILPFVYAIRKKMRTTATKKKYPEIWNASKAELMEDMPHHKVKEMLKR